MINYKKKFVWNNAETLQKKTGGFKARRDVSNILESSGYFILKYYNSTNIFVKIIYLIFNVMTFPFYVNISSLLFVQYPINHGQRLILMLYKKLLNLKTVYLVHDLESLRLNRGIYREVNDFLYADQLIVLNAVMGKYVNNVLGYKNKIVELTLWDYLYDSKNTELYQKRMLSDKGIKVLIAGNLDPRKSGYLSRLKEIKNINFYLLGYCPNMDKLIGDNVHYLGEFDSDFPPNFSGANSIYGLVWDGDSVNSCEGDYGKYLKYNLPHKTSLYLSLGVPILSWSGAAVTKVLSEKKICVAIDSLYDIEESITRELISFENLASESKSLRSGCYLKKACKALG